MTESSTRTRQLGILLVFGLAIAAGSLYAAGDWRNGDVSLYHVYALGFWGGLPHPLLPVEYPPLSILPFSFTLAGPPTWYPDTFAFWMGVLFALGYLAFRRYTTPGHAGAYVVYGLAAGPATLLFRYDLVPALVVVAALWLIQRHRFASAYPLLALGVLLKLYPLVLLPVAAIAHARADSDGKRKRASEVAMGAGACLAIVVAGFAIATIVDPKGGLGSLTFNFRRPSEVESLPASLIWLGSLIGIPATASASFDSFNLTGSLSPFVSALAGTGLVAGLVWVYWRQGRGHLTSGQATLAAVLVVLCTSTVLSAQFLIWVVPLLATTVGFQTRWLAVCVLTALIFPALFEVGIAQGVSIAYSPWFLAVIAVRNALLLILTVRFLIAPGVELPLWKAQRVRRYALGANR
jgi:Glycosyltransferase family 87